MPRRAARRCLRPSTPAIRKRDVPPQPPAMNSSQPLVSIILCVRNGMPHVKNAIASVRALTYENYELVIQDGASTDGTLEYLQGLTGFASVAIQSAPDSGIGQGFNRAVQRCRGEIVGSVDADNQLAPDALNIVTRAFAEHPEAAVVYGACDMITPDGGFLHRWPAPPFDALDLIDGTLVPPFATSFFSPAVCGSELRFDEQMPTVVDFDLWLRLAPKPIVMIADRLADVRIGKASSTWDPTNYQHQVRYKLFALERCMHGPAREPILEQLHRRADAGIYLWAADSMAVIGAGPEKIDEYFNRAGETDVTAPRFRDIATRAQPKIFPSNTGFAARVFNCGQLFFERGRWPEARVYFELLRRSEFDVAHSTSMIEACLRQEYEASLSLDIAVELQNEVTRRDAIIVELQNEINRRDDIIVDRHNERVDAVGIRDQIINGLREELRTPIRTAARQWRARVSRVLKGA